MRKHENANSQIFWKWSSLPSSTVLVPVQYRSNKTKLFYGYSPLFHIKPS